MRPDAVEGAQDARSVVAPCEAGTAASKPLLSIAVPTFNRAAYLEELLAVLGPQLGAHPEVELLVCDNASSDQTPAVCENFRVHFPDVPFRLFRHAENIGSDANFAFAFEHARGHFFWLCGDDDIIVPGALDNVLAHLGTACQPAAVDLLYATSYSFRHDFLAERTADPFGRRFHTFTRARQFAAAVNIMFTFISGIIVNKTQLESFPHEAPSALIGTNLVQLAWSIPLLAHFRRGIVLWQRPVAGRRGNAHGYRLGSVFGEKLKANLDRLLPGRPELAAPILHFALRRWFPDMILGFRTDANATLGLDRVHHDLQHVFGRNPRYWLFTYPAIVLPLPLAKLYTRLSALVSKAIYVTHQPLFWRKQT